MAGRTMKNDMDMLRGTWEIHTRQTELVLGYLSHEQLSLASENDDRTIGARLANLINNRLNWLESIAPALTDGLVEISPDQGADLVLIQEEYGKTSNAVDRLIGLSQRTGGKLKGFDGTISTFIGYLIAYEWYHIGEIGAILGQVGQPIPKNKAYDLWDWRETNY